MNQNPYQATRQTMDAVHEAMQRWAGNILERAGAGHVPVRTAFPDDGSDTTLVVLPYRLTLWPKLIENAQPVALLGANPRQAAQSGVPEAWMTLADLMSTTLRSVFPSAKNKAGVVVILPNAPLSDLPQPLADWYDGQADVDDPGWLLESNTGPKGRLPTLGWVPGIKLRVHYLAQVAGGDGEKTGAAGLISAVTVGLHLDRAIQVERPPAPLESRYLDMLRAVAASAPSELADPLHAAIEAVASVATHTLPVLPHEAPASDDFAEIMRSLQRPLQPTLMLQLQVPVAGHPEIVPAVSPQFPTHRKPEPGEEE